ncbi:MAG: tRNA wybutosine-synthesizing 3 family protein [Nanoarchaeota archaeon]
MVMAIDNFSQKKKDVLSRKDNSHIGEVDKRISKLCKKINFMKDYYTTSSCSGRILLMMDIEEKREWLFLKMYHDKVSFKELKKELNLLKVKWHKGIIKFKQESCILHISCKSLEDAKKIYELAKISGFKRIGLVAWGKNFILEISSTEKLEFPIMKNGNILISDEFLKLVVKQANKKLGKSWGKIDKLSSILQEYA